MQVAEQRKQYKLHQDGKQSSITIERITLLNQLGFAWNAQHAAWNTHMNNLKLFRNENGHCHVPLNHAVFPKLGLWVKEQRRHYSLMKKQDPSSHMTAARAAELDAIGFCWDTHEASWQERLRDLQHYRVVHGHCCVPTNYIANPKLGTWVHHQRREFKKYQNGKSCHITESRIRALNELGFVWHPREQTTGSLPAFTHDAAFDESSNEERRKRRRHSQ